MKFSVKAICHQGYVRENMEDSTYPPCGFEGVLDTPFSVAVADGVGGLPGGEVASSIAVRYAEHIKDVKDVKKQLFSAHLDIQSTFPGAATTLTLALLTDDFLDVYWIGDSYAVYIQEDGTFYTITRPHVHPGTGYITRVLGIGEPIFDSFRIDVEDVLHLLLFTDGFTAHFSIPEIVKMFLRREDLIENTLRAGGFDNMALVTVSKIS